MIENISNVIQWLLSGDVSIQYQTHRDLLESSGLITATFQKRIASEGWGKKFMDLRDPETGLWANAVYSPKWISLHYTLLDLKNLGIDPTTHAYKESSEILLDRMWSNKGSIVKMKKPAYQDLCVCAMIISICCHAKIDSNKLSEMVDYILDKQFSDGGWNCSWNRGAVHSSLHTTLSVLEAFRDYELEGYHYRIDDIKNSIPKAWEFILKKHLFRSVHTGEIIKPNMLMLSYPCRWKYDVLRCLDYFSSVQKTYDGRMEEALDLIIKKKRENNHWPVQYRHSGKVHFMMESIGKDSRWNTLRVLRVLKLYKPELYKSTLMK